MNIPILMYHEVIDAKEEAALKGRVRPMAETYYVKSDAFEAQLKFLSDRGFKTIALDNLARRIKEHDRWRVNEKSIIISFDDGYEGNFTHAFPLLKQYGFHAVFFVTTNWIGQPGMMTWQMLAQMAREGMSIQSHTKTHPFLKQLSDEQVACELQDSKLAIEQHLSTQVRFVSLPNGSYGENYKKLAIEAGYTGGCSSHIGYNTAATDGFLMQRILVSSHYTIREFRQIVLNEGFFVLLLEFKQMVRSFVRSLMGENLYMSIYRVIFGIR